MERVDEDEIRRRISAGVNKEVCPSLRLKKIESPTNRRKERDDPQASTQKRLSFDAQKKKAGESQNINHEKP